MASLGQLATLLLAIMPAMACALAVPTTPSVPAVLQPDTFRPNTSGDMTSPAEHYTACQPTSAKTCIMGMLLSYSQDPMTATVYDHSCRVLGQLSGMQFDLQYTLTTPNLPNPITISPHYDGPPEFWYEGRHYQNGWDYTALDNYEEWYEWLAFGCED